MLQYLTNKTKTICKIVIAVVVVVVGIVGIVAVEFTVQNP